MPVLGLIPARSGSKGIPDKNLKKVAGKSILQRAIETSVKAEILDRIIVSTDDPMYAENAVSWGADVPFLRSAESAQDHSTDRDVAVELLGELARREGYRPKSVVWIRPTSPLRKPEDIVRAVEILNQANCDAVRSVHKVKSHPYWAKTISDEGILSPFIQGFDEAQYPRRQTLPPVFVINGLVDVISVDQIARNKPLFAGRIAAYEVEPWRGLDIDVPTDLVIANALLEM